jgi:hypothetical protein
MPAPRCAAATYVHLGAQPTGSDQETKDGGFRVGQGNSIGSCVEKSAEADSAGDDEYQAADDLLLHGSPRRSPGYARYVPERQLLPAKRVLVAGGELRVSRLPKTSLSVSVRSSRMV